MKKIILVFKYLVPILTISLPFFYYYFNSLEIYAYHELFKIDYSFFNNDATEIKAWNSLVLFIYVLTHSTYAIFMLLAFIIITAIAPIVITRYLFSDEELRKGMAIIIVYCLSTMSSFLLLITLCGFLQISDIFIFEIRNKFLSENPNYCRIVNNNESHVEFNIIENSSVPYKLSLESSSIQYYKPNEGKFLWKALESSEIKSMQDYCIEFHKIKK